MARHSPLPACSDLCRLWSIILATHWLDLYLFLLEGPHPAPALVILANLLKSRNVHQIDLFGIAATNDFGGNRLLGCPCPFKILVQETNFERERTCTNNKIPGIHDGSCVVQP